MGTALFVSKALFLRVSLPCKLRHLLGPVAKWPYQGNKLLGLTIQTTGQSIFMQAKRLSSEMMRPWGLDLGRQTWKSMGEEMFPVTASLSRCQSGGELFLVSEN